MDLKCLKAALGAMNFRKHLSETAEALCAKGGVFTWHSDFRQEYSVVLFIWLVWQSSLDQMLEKNVLIKF